MSLERIRDSHVPYGLLNFNDLIEKLSFHKGWKCNAVTILKEIDRGASKIDGFTISYLLYGRETRAWRWSAGILCEVSGQGIQRRRTKTFTDRGQS